MRLWLVSSNRLVPFVLAHKTEVWGIAAMKGQGNILTYMCRQKGHKQPLTDEELRQATPCELVRSALPADLAEELLVLLLAESPSWHRGQWVLFGKTHAAPRTSCYYSLEQEGVSIAQYSILLLGSRGLASMRSCFGRQSGPGPQ